MSEKGKISVPRFIEKLDACFRRDDLRAAEACIAAWEREARSLGDRRGLLSVLNEAVGCYRRTRQEEKALTAVRECLAILEELHAAAQPSGATVLVNAATTLASFGQEEAALPLYARAACCYAENGLNKSYENAALLNNSAAALYALRRYDEAEEHWRRAIAILRREGCHDGEIALSLVMLAHLAYDRDDTAFPQVEALLDEAWEMLNSPRQPRDGNYAFILTKCAPSFDYFQRPEAAQALREVAKEIYEGT